MFLRSGRISTYHPLKPLKEFLNGLEFGPERIMISISRRDFKDPSFVSHDDIIDGEYFIGSVQLIVEQRGSVDGCDTMLEVRRIKVTGIEKGLDWSESCETINIDCIKHADALVRLWFEPQTEYNRYDDY